MSVVVSERLASIDAVRGLGVLGILVMNVVAFAMPTYAYADPSWYGGDDGADLATWAAAYVLADGKMRALFAMLFGASLTIVADRAGEDAAARHHRRMAWLLAIGMLHAWLLWFGDILVAYAVTGVLLFPFRDLPFRALVGVWAGAVLLLAAGALLAWALPGTARGGPLLTPAAEIAGYRGSWLDALAIRAPVAAYFQTVLLIPAVIESGGFMALGIALLRSGFLGGAWTARTYLRIAAVGYLVAAPPMIPLAWWVSSNGFEPAAVLPADAASLLLRTPIALAHASVLLWLWKTGRLRWLTDRLAAVGRMALTNYIATSAVMTSLFYGYGLGLYGRLDRAELVPVTLGMWALMLAWSAPWLRRFRHGPLEWAWRSLALWRRQPFRR